MIEPTYNLITDLTASFNDELESEPNWFKIDLARDDKPAVEYPLGKYLFEFPFYPDCLHLEESAIPTKMMLQIYREDVELLHEVKRRRSADCDVEMQRWHFTLELDLSFVKHEPHPAAQDEITFRVDAMRLKQPEQVPDDYYEDERRKEYRGVWKPRRR